jgi:hypothetical protein
MAIRQKGVVILQVFLQPGDVCRLEIDGIGVLENPVVAIDHPAHLELFIERGAGQR